MNVENFGKYLEELSLLYQLPYEELKSLAMQYPFSQNLHQLLALKSKLEDHPDYEKNLAKAATLSPDRSHLFQLLQKVATQVEKEESFVLNEEYLELKDIKQVERIPLQETVDHTRVDIPGPTLSLQDIEPTIDPEPTEVPLSFEPDTEEEDETTPLELTPVFIPSAAPEMADTTEITEEEVKNEEIIQEQAYTADAELLQAIATGVRITQDVRVHKTIKSIKARIKKQDKSRRNGQRVPGPTPKSSFSSWVQQFQPAHLRPQVSELMEAKKMDEAKQARKNKQHALEQAEAKVAPLVERSITEHDELASETLAELLTAQMQYDKAIKVYERLSLKFPEKSSFFADKIKKLKKLLA